MLSLRHLKRHLKTQSGEKSNKCNKCDYASCHASDLKTHWKTHSGEKSNKCNQCDYASSQASHLRTHLKTHSGGGQTLQTVWLFLFWPKFFGKTYMLIYQEAQTIVSKLSQDSHKIITNLETWNSIWNKYQQLYLWTGTHMRKY